MELDDELCLCFHVSKRKVISFIRVERPARVGQLSECFGAGTGCGWCRVYLRKLFEQERGMQSADSEPTAREHALGRAQYVRAGGGTPPPGATPIDAEPSAEPLPPTSE
jgi:bacterioferritin-associated ferredoxin